MSTTFSLPLFKTGLYDFSTYLTVTGTAVKLCVGLGIDPIKAPDGIAMTGPYVADGHGIRSFAHVPKRHLAADQAARQKLRVPVVELQSDDWVRRLDREVWNGGVLCESTKVISHNTFSCIKQFSLRKL